MTKDRPGVIAPPPILLLIPFAAGATLQHGFNPEALALGVLIVAKGFVLVLWALLSFHRAKTTPNPFGATTAIVSYGPYRLSRNPMYVAMAIMYIGFSIACSSWLALLLLPLALLAIHYGVIKREERYLSRKFGEPYDEYARRVRRWL